ncbi:MAG: PD-(D/E)XK nuclease family protein [Bacteroidota bacterium]|nr:PD-(D/E)XK nuclease family protein [Bacteroidota bacterium]
MTPFLLDTANYIHQHFGDQTRELMIVLPNKRGALFLKRHLANIYNKTIWLPKIISAEEFIAELSGMQSADSITLSALLYDSYVSVMKDKAESFDGFIKWSNMLMQDYNEIDRYLIEAKSIYKNLAEIKEIENWSLAREEKTDMQRNYIAFMSSLGDVYEHYTKQLETKQIAYQGLAYKNAVRNTLSGKINPDSYLNKNTKIIFAGFNALNRAEEVLFNYFIEQQGAIVLWDIDNYYFSNELHEAGNFLRKHFTKEQFRSESFITNNLKEQVKNIQVIGAAQNMAQVATATSVLKEWIYKGVDLNKTAIVLCDESLLFPLLSVLPEEIEAVNVSLEYPLSQSTLYDLSEQLVNMHINKKQNSAQGAIYYKDLMRVLQNPYFALLYGKENNANKLAKGIAEKNISYFSVKTLNNLFGDNYENVRFLFEGWDSAIGAVTKLKLLSERLLNKFDPDSYRENTAKFLSTETEFVFEFGKLITRLEEVCSSVNYINELKTLRKIIQQLVSGASVPFFGEPLKGLQIMGVLETRTLDFENLILISVNENILPSGKSANTFIPFDLKKYFRLPVYQDKDAIYAYHFYRLIQKAESIALIYNTETDTLGKGEKSRFITQLLTELPRVNKNAVINESIAISEVGEKRHTLEISIEKTDELIERTKAKAFTPERSGFSPSLLNSYKDCSLRFYFNYLAHIKEPEEVEESVEAGTFGTILHYVLEHAYANKKDIYLNEADFSEILPKIEELTQSGFKEQYSESEFKQGKNYLAYHTIKIYAENLIRADAEYVKSLTANKNSLKILDLEKKLEWVIDLNTGKETVKVKFSGTCDRIDATADHFRIVDYKSSVNETNDKFEFVGFEELFSNKKYNKAFQLFVYAWLAWRNNMCEPEKIRTCIVPFKGNKKSEYYILEQRSDNKQPAKPLQYTQELLEEFEKHLQNKTSELFDKSIPYTQTEDDDKCTYCAYNGICNRI